MGKQCMVLGHKKADAELSDFFEIARVFSQSHYEYLSSDPYSMLLDDLLTGGRTFGRELIDADFYDVQGDDVVILPTAGPREIAGLCWCLQQRHLRPKVVALFHSVEPPQAPLNKGSSAGAIYRHVGRLLHATIDRRRALVLATNETLAKELSLPLGLDVAKAPVPVWYDPNLTRAVVTNRLGQPAIVTFMGQMRWNHGYKEIPDIVAAINRKDIFARCIIHVGAPDEKLDLSAYSKLQDTGVAEIVAGYRSEEEIAGLVKRSTVIVLPYDRRSYRNRVSAVMCTAIAGGCACVVPSKTWLEKQVEERRAAGVVYSGDTPESVADAVQVVLAHSDAYSEQARSRARHWIENESGPKLVEKIMRWSENNSQRSDVGK